MTSHPLGNVFEAMMEKGQNQIPDEGFMMTKILLYLGVLLRYRTLALNLT